MKLFRGVDRPADPPADPIIRSLRALAQGFPELRDAAQVYEVILPMLRDADIGITPVSLTGKEVRKKMEMGEPLLHGLDLEFEGQSVCNLMVRLAGGLEKIHGNGPVRAESSRRIRIAIEDSSLDISSLLSQIVAGQSNAIRALALDLQLDPDLLLTLAQNAFKPALRAWCNQLTPLANGVRWEKGCCFVCGAVAALGELRENNLVKHLRCGQCGADWLFRRLQCMYCGNEDHRTLGCLYTENRDEKVRVEVCEKCKGYLKVITAFAPTPPEMLPVEDLATLHLDYIAVERGYGRREIH